MPFSAGFHPYIRTPLTAVGRRDCCFAKLPAAREYRATGVVADADCSPVCLRASEIGAPARHFGDVADYRAEIDDVLRGVKATIQADFSPSFKCLTAWSPGHGAPFCCIERRTALPDPFSPGVRNQLIVLAPGATFVAAMVLDAVVSSGLTGVKSTASGSVSR
jgi:galactose mutarotase-like enzyme